MCKKTCSKCGVEKELNEFNKNPASKDGLRGSCRQCQKSYLETRKANRVSVGLRVTEQTCSCCKQTKPIVEFQPNANAATGYTKECRECKRRKWHEYNQSRPGWNAERKREYRKNGGVEKDREYYRNNKDKLRVQGRLWHYNNKEARNRKIAEWRANNPSSYFKIKNARRQRLVQANYSHWQSDKFREVTKALIEEKYKLERITGNKYHIDHIIPLAGKNVCGLHVWNNLQLLPAVDNLSKSNRFE